MFISEYIGIETAVRAIRPAELELPNGRRLGLQIGSVQIGNPSTSPSFTGTTGRKSTGMDVKLLYPSGTAHQAFLFTS